MTKTRKYRGPDRRKFAREEPRDRPVGAKADNVVKLGGVEVGRGGEEYARGTDLQRTQPGSPSRDHIKQAHIPPG